MRPQVGYLPDDSVFPLRGLNVFAPSTMLPPPFSPFVENVDLTKGIASKRRGYSVLGNPILDIDGVAITQPILALIEFEDLSDNKTLVAITTTRQYKYDPSSEDWTDITRRGTSYSITAVNTGTKTFTIQPGSDLSSTYTVGSTFAVVGSTGNDGNYKVASRSYSAPNFAIVVTQTIPDATVDGTLGHHALWTGDEDDYVDYAIGIETSGRTLIVTNGRDSLIQWDGSGLFETFTPTLSGFVTCRTVEIFYDSLWLGNILTASNEPQLLAWSEEADFDDFTAEGSGNALITDAKGAIQKLLKLGDRLVVYAEDSIGTAINVGGDVQFAFEQLIQGTRLLSGRAIVNLGPYHLFASQENFYLYDGSRMIRPIGDAVHKIFREEVALAEATKVHAFHDFVRREVYWTILTSASEHVIYLLEYDVYEIENLKWTRHVFADRPTVFGFFSRDASLKWNSPQIASEDWNTLAQSWNAGSFKDDFPVRVFGNSAGEVFLYDGTVLTDDGGAISARWDSKDFVVPEVYRSLHGRWIEIEIELRGTGVDVYYSLDNGSTFFLQQSLTLTSEWTMMKVYLDKVSRSFRVSLRNTASTGWFELRFLRVWLRGAGNR